MQNLTEHHWHELPETEVVRRLDSNQAHGLAKTEVEARQRQFGPNRMEAKKARNAWKRFLFQFAQPLMYILLMAAVVTLFLGEYVDSAVIFGVTLINAVVGFIQENKAEKAIDALAKMVQTEATVRRDGQVQRVNSENLVPGDIVLLQSGDKVPADMRLLEVRNLQIDESALTGESVPVEKHHTPLTTGTALADRKNLAFAGTLVTYGQAQGAVVAIGSQTETGRIATLIEKAPDLSTPLTRKIAHFSTVILWVILVFAGATFGIGVARGQNIGEMFMASVALAVGAIPEGLPAAVTITLAIGVSRMARQRAIIRKLPAVEALGSTTVICSDKTGTLTENKMTVQQIFAGGKFFDITGTGYEAGGEVIFGDRRASPEAHRALSETLLAGMLNNDARLVRDGDQIKVEGDPTEAALIVAAQKSGLIHADAHSTHPRIDVIPFESEHQFMATLHHREQTGARVIYTKGSVERLIQRCSQSLGDGGELGPLDPSAIHAAVEQMAARGLRVLAFARMEASGDHDELRHEHVKKGLTFLGLQGMIDPPRAEAIAAVRKCQEAGIEVKMITGDHALTARSIALQLGIRGSSDHEVEAVTGRDLENQSDSDLTEIAERTPVFARIAPEQKLRIVRALQARGHIVAMTGDGVNDAPALKQADIGVAMGITGTDVAKGAADILLTDDNFATIEAAVEEGRAVFLNLTKFIVWTLPTNAGAAAILIAAIVMGTALPALPVQLLWVNMTTSVLLGLTLVFEPKEKDLMQRPPRDPHRPIITVPLLMRIGLVALLMFVGAYAAFLWEQQTQGKNLMEARTTVVNVIVVVECFYLLNCRSLLHSVASVGFGSNPFIFAGIGAMLAAQFLFTYAPVMNRLFHTAPLGALSWLYIVGVGLISFLLVETEKWIRSKARRVAEGTS